MCIQWNWGVGRPFIELTHLGTIETGFRIGSGEYGGWQSDRTVRTSEKNTTSTHYCDGGRILTVQLRHDDSDLRPDLVLDEQADDLQLPEEVSVVEPSTALDDATSVVLPEPQTDQLTATDWRNMITKSVVAIGNEKATQEASRSSMWRRTHSIMFQSDSEHVLTEQDPIIPDFRFKPQVYVAGLGITIGSCFIGIPLVGVPVEERTVAVRLFVCAKG